MTEHAHVHNCGCPRCIPRIGNIFGSGDYVRGAGWTPERCPTCKAIEFNAGLLS